ncbi:Uncharacterised protein [Mycobacteroides abscessus subsp. abscessus]|nr:Uncharacterised protein [Mycobacteroides abscessus subsp. abscessus]
MYRTRAGTSAVRVWHYRKFDPLILARARCRAVESRTADNSSHMDLLEARY